MKKDKTIKVDEKTEKVLKEALDNLKTIKRIQIGPHTQSDRKEKAIDDIYTIEKLEKQL